MGKFLDRRLEKLRDTKVADFATMTDTEMVIRSTSMLDNFLGLALVVRFNQSLSETQYASLFGGKGPLEAFSAKITAGLALGLVVGDMQHDLTVLRKLRNDFAHTAGNISLSDKEQSGYCKSLKMEWGLSDEVLQRCGTVERKKLLNSVTAVMAHLTITIQRGITERQVLIEQMVDINKRAAAAIRKLSEKDAAAT